jgi:hypothetical protein
VHIIPQVKGYFEIYSISGTLVDSKRCEAPIEIASRLNRGMYILKFIADSGQTASVKLTVGR